MKIEKIRLKNYKQFTDQEVVFRQGLNFLIGPNESGKSTVLSGIFDALYTDPNTSSRKYFDEVVSWGTKIKPEIFIEFTNGDYQYSISKNFNTGESLLVGDKLELRNQIDISNFLFEKCKIPLSDVYKSTGYIRQEEISNLVRSDSLLSVIQSAIAQNSDSVNTKTILKQLDEDIRELERGSRTLSKNPGAQKLLIDEVDGLTKEIGEINFSRARTGELTDKLTKLRDEQQALMEKQATLDRMLKDFESVREIKTEIDSIDQKIKDLRSDKETVAKIEDAIGMLERNRQRILEKYNGVNIDEISTQFRQYEDEQKEYFEKLKNLSQVQYRSIPQRIVFLSVIMGIFSILLIVLGLPWLYLGIVFSIYPLVQIFTHLGRIGKTQSINNSIVEINSLINIVEDKKLALLEPYGVSSVEMMHEESAKVKGIVKDIEQQNDLIVRILKGKSKEHVEKIEESLVSQKHDLSIISKKNSASEISLEEFTRQRIDFEKVIFRLDSLSKDIIEVSKEIELGAISDEKLYEKQIQLEDKTRKLELIRNEILVLKTTQEILQEAINDRIAVASSIIRNYVDRYLPILTDGKYTKSRVDEKLKMTLYIGSTDSWKDPDKYLSTGTRDLINLLARIAFFDIVSTTAPIIMDDPFVSFDKNRQQNVFEMLDEISKQRQIIVISHNLNYKNYTKASIIEF